MNLAELSKLDVKDIKAFLSGAHVQDIWQNKIVVLNTALVLITLTVVVLSFGGRANENKQIGKKITELEERLAAVTQQNDITQNLNNFLEKFPGSLESDRVVNVLTDLAEKHNVQIRSISPLRTDQRQLYTKTTLDLSISVQNFQDLGWFIREIEKNGSTLYVEKFSGTLNSSAGQQHEAQSAIESTITVALVQLKK